MKWFTGLSKRLRVILSILAGISIIFVIILLIAPNYIAGYITDNGKALCGRKLVVNDIDINYFTGGLSVEDFVMYEKNETDTFCSFKEFYVNVDLWKSVFSDFSVAQISLISPHAVIIQDTAHFNFDDLISFFTEQDSAEVEDDSQEDIAYYLNNISVEEAEVTYILTTYNSIIGLENIDVSCPTIHSDDPLINAHITTDFRHGGNGIADISVNIRNSTYSVHNTIDSLNLIFLEPVLQGFMNISSFKGRFSSDLFVEGSYENTDTLNLSGNMDLYGFNMIDKENNPFLSIHAMHSTIDTIMVSSSTFDFGDIIIDSLYNIYEMYPNGSNIDKLLSYTEASENSVAAEADTIDPYEDESVYEMIARYTRTYFTDYSITAYEIENLEVNRSSFVFNDFTLEEPFSYQIDNIRLTGKDLSSKKERVFVDASCLLNKKGEFTGRFSVNPQDFMDLQIDYTIDHFVVDDFTHHSKYYVAHPILSGDMQYQCKLVLKDGIITNENYITIDEFYFGNKSRSGALYDLPVKLAASLLKDNKGVINLDIPVSGDINDPDFSVWSVVWNVLKNMIIKVATAPYKLVSGWFEGNEDDARQILFDYNDSTLEKNAGKTVSGLTKLLQDKPELNIQYLQLADSAKEFEQLAIEIAKRKYLELNNDPSDITTELIGNLSVHDSLFVSYLDNQRGVNDTITPPQQKCVLIANKQEIVTELTELRAGRNHYLDSLMQEAGIASERYTIQIGSEEDMRSENSLPKFLIKYEAGDVDPNLVSSVEDPDGLNKKSEE